jgi:hypothetical protein
MALKISAMTAGLPANGDGLPFVHGAGNFQCTRAELLTAAAGEGIDIVGAVATAGFDASDNFTVGLDAGGTFRVEGASPAFVEMNGTDEVRVGDVQLFEVTHFNGSQRITLDGANPIFITYDPANPTDWNGDPTNVVEALDRIAAALALLQGFPIP